MSTADLCVIFNPKAGRGRAGQRLQRLRALLGPKALFEMTTGPGHGEELAYNAVVSGIPVVAAAGGDGTVHEVANGLLRAGRREAVLEVYPIGSANDYAHSLGLDPEWKLRGDPDIQVHSVDVGVVRAADGRQRYFVNSVGLGFNGEVNLEARRIGFFQGRILYNIALLCSLWRRFHAPEMTISLDGQPRCVPTLALTVAIGRREGNFILAPDAIVDDGLFEYLHVGALSRWELIRNLLRINTGKLPTHPRIWRGRCSSIRIESRAPLPFHLDGELFENHEQPVTDLEARLIPAGLRVTVHRRQGYLAHQL
jgi:diacylglycerol kinase family enzyme